jgi:hypothetical protein
MVHRVVAIAGEMRATLDDEHFPAKDVCRSFRDRGADRTGAADEQIDIVEHDRPPCPGRV